jgi:catechol 2,3-dioxygenase-like lactoylglutathione lyase family enzyme
MNHIGLPAADVDSAAVFYSRLGFSHAGRFRNPESGEDVVFMRLDSLVLELYHSSCPAVPGQGAIDHIALQVEDIDAAFEAVRLLGLSPAGNRIDFLPFWERGVRFFKIAGINGEIIEFIQVL